MGVSLLSQVFRDCTTEYFIFDGDNVLASYDSGGNLSASYATPLLGQCYSAKQLAAKHEGYGGQAGLDANLSMTNSTDSARSATSSNRTRTWRIRMITARSGC